MPAKQQEDSEFRIEKGRRRAIVTLSTGDVLEGCFFVARSSTHGPVPERVADVLNAEGGFFPFELGEGATSRTILLNRDRIVTIALAENEARYDPGYDIATQRDVILRFANGRQLHGLVRVYRPEGR